MRSTLLIGCLLWAVVYVHPMTRVERGIIKKRAASPQIYQGAQSNNWNQTQQFQWVKVNNQWVKKDGSNKLPGYSQPNVPYNQTGNQWNTPAPSRSASPAQPSSGKPGQQQQPAHITPQRQDSTGSIGWNPSADRALTADVIKTTTTTTTTTRAPQTPPPTQKHRGPTPTPLPAPFGSGIRGSPNAQKGGFNPDTRLTYDGLPSQTNPNANKAKQTKPSPAGPSNGSNPWGSLSI